MYACATHGVLSGPGRRSHPRLEPRRGRHHRHHPADAAAKQLRKITNCPVAPLIGEAIRRIHEAESVGALFSSEIQLVQEMGLWSEIDDEETADAAEDAR